MQEIVVIDGEISLENTLDGEVELEAITDLDPDVVIGTGGIVYPHYTGSYTVTPSGSVQTLDTSDKVMDDDVTVQAVPQGSATTPATIITANPTISVSSGGLITATVSKTQQVTPTVQEGYVSAGTPGNVGVSGSNTQQLTTQGAQTIHPASTDQSIASGKYLTGNQTFKAVTVTGLTANKVLQGTTVEIGDSDDSDRIMKVVGTASGGITPTGNINITQAGVTDVTDYATATVPSLTLGEVSLTPIGTQVDVINPSTTSTQYLNIPTGFHNSAQYYSIPAVALGTKSITENGTYNAYVDSVYGYSSVTVNVSGGGSLPKTGTFTPTSVTGSLTVNTGLTTLNGMLLRIKQDPTYGTNKTTVSLWIDNTSTAYIKFVVTAKSSSVQTFEYWLLSTPPYTISGGTISFDFPYRNTTGYFATVTYEWLAW